MSIGIYAWCLDGVYKYVGKSHNLEQRMYDKHKDSPILKNAIRKYGYDSFEKIVICYCEIEELNEKEIFFIKEFKTHRDFGGYNLTKGGDGLSGKDHPFYGKKRPQHSIIMKQRMKGKHHSVYD